MFRKCQKMLHTSSLPAPVNTGVGNDERRHVIQYTEKMTPAEFLSQMEDFRLAGRSALVCDYDFSREHILLRQLMGYLKGIPRVLICNENQLPELDFMKHMFPTGVVSGRMPEVNGIYILSAEQSLQELKNFLTAYRVYPVIYMACLTLDNSALRILTSLSSGYMLLIDRDPSTMVEISDERIRLFCTDYVMAGGYPGAALQCMSDCLWSYEKLVTQHMTSMIPEHDSFSVVQMEKLEETPVFRKDELDRLSKQGQFLIADRLRHVCMVGNIYEKQEEKISLFRKMVGKIF